MARRSSKSGRSLSWKISAKATPSNITAKSASKSARPAPSQPLSTDTGQQERIMKVNPYIFFNGNCEEALKFYARITGGTINAMMPHAGTPAESHVPAEWRSKIMHANMTIGDTLLMASDAAPGPYAKPQGFSVSLNGQDTAPSEPI